MGETTDRGVFDFMAKKKEEKCEVVEVPDMIEFEPDKNGEDDNNHNQLQRSRSHSSSSSDEEIGEGGERKKKKTKGLKEKIKDKISNDHSNEEEQQQMDYKDTPLTDPIANYEEMGKIEENNTGLREEKKGFLEKIKEKLPGQHKKPEEGFPMNKAECYDGNNGGEAKEKKGILEKIKEKLPGGHKNHEEEVKEKEN